LMERQGINATFNSGALYWKGKYLLAVRTEGVDRKSFFAIAESPNGIDNFRFWDYPVTMPETDRPDTNVYDMRLTAHEDGWIYGLFCTERKDMNRPDDISAAEAQCGIARTKDLINWERLPDLITHSGQQRNVVLHPEFVDGKYGLYTRPQDGFISVGSGGGIGWGLADDMTRAEIKSEVIVDGKVYHTIKEVKNGQGPAPIKTSEGWLHLAHGVRNTAAGLRYVLYMFMTELKRPCVVTHRPGGHFIAPHGTSAWAMYQTLPLLTAGLLTKRTKSSFITRRPIPACMWPLPPSKNLSTTVRTHPKMDCARRPQYRHVIGLLALT